MNTTTLDYNGLAPRTFSAQVGGFTCSIVEIEPSCMTDDGRALPEFEVYVDGVGEVGTVTLLDGEAVLEPPVNPRGPVLSLSWDADAVWCLLCSPCEGCGEAVHTSEFVGDDRPDCYADNHPAAKEG